MKVTLPPVSFGVGRPVREEMVEDINEALDKDVHYEIPANYMKGEGDSEFIALILDEAILCGDKQIGTKREGVERERKREREREKET